MAALEKFMSLLALLLLSSLTSAPSCIATSISVVSIARDVILFLDVSIVVVLEGYQHGTNNNFLKTKVSVALNA